MALILEFNRENLERTFRRYLKSDEYKRDKEDLISNLTEGYTPETQDEIKAETIELCGTVCTLIDHRLRIFSFWRDHKARFDEGALSAKDLLSQTKVLIDHDNALSLTPEYQRDTSEETIPKRLFSFYEEIRKKFNTFKAEYEALGNNTNSTEPGLLPAPADSGEDTSDVFNRNTSLNAPSTALNLFEQYINTTMPEEARNVIQTLTTDLEQGIGTTLRRSIDRSQRQAIERTRDILGISKLWADGLERYRQGKQDMTALLSDIQRLFERRKQPPDINSEHLPEKLLQHWESAEKFYENTKNAVNTFYYHARQAPAYTEDKVIPLFRRHPPQ